MNEFESDWISLSQSQIGVRVFLSESENDNKVSEYKMAVSESNMTYYKMAAIIKFSQNEWVKFFLCKWWESKLVKCEWVWEEDTKMAESNMVEFRLAEFKMAAIIRLIKNE